MPPMHTMAHATVPERTVANAADLPINISTAGRGRYAGLICDGEWPIPLVWTTTPPVSRQTIQAYPDPDQNRIS